MTGKVLIQCMLCCAGFLPAFSQVIKTANPPSNLRTRTISTRISPLKLDSVSIVPNSFQIPGISDSLYQIDEINSTISWKSGILFDSVVVKYRVFPFRLNASARRMSYDSIMNNFMGKPFVPDYGTETDADRFFNFGNITYNGSFGRGISFGNTQDVVVTSNLNLQLSGYLADSIEMMAAITDNNIPIQPDGTTQQLNEFDRIFLQFKKNNWQLSLGDIDIRQNQLYFLNFYKRLQGVAFETTTPLSAKTSNRSLVSGSIAKGKFTRNIFQGQEGNQGPYRLVGANNEFYFVVLANTERVYLDGVPMQRGDDQDYIINYNTAEIAFTPKRMITKDTRIQVEFEYSDRNYLNSNLYAYNETNFSNKFKLRVGAFSNIDAKNSPINQTLNDDQIDFLDSIGRNINRAFYPNAVIDTFSSGSILYKKIDTTYNGGANTDSIYVYSINSDSAMYSLTFSDVGQGNGDYVPDFNGANGKVYKWVAPVNDVRMGRYEPAIFLVTPKKQQLISLGMDYLLGKTGTVTGEVAMSNVDLNTFSDKDRGNKGFASKLLLKNSIPLGTASKEIRLGGELGYEFVDSQFRPLERLRNVEFTRDWGLPLVVVPQDETIITAASQLTGKTTTMLRYQFTLYNRGNSFRGYRNSLLHIQNLKGWRFNNLLQLSNVEGVQEKGYFFRPTLSLVKSFSKLKDHSLSVSYSVEHNEIHNKNTDTVAPQSFSFSIFQTTIKSSEAKDNRYGITYFTRTDAYPYGKELAKADRSQNITLFTELLKNPRHRFRFNTTYRTLTILQQGITGLKPDESLLGRAEYDVNEWKGLVTGSILYEIGAGQEQKRDFSFLEVPAGQGEYTWIDYDNNGIQSLNEFEVALFQDQATYIRIYTPTNEFVKANYNTFNYNFSLSPRAVIASGKKGLSDILSRINFQSSMQINRKQVAQGVVEFNPFRSSIEDTSLITLNSIFVNTLSFNRFSTRWGVDLNNTRSGNKSLLTYGYEIRKLQDWTLRLRYNITRQVSVDIAGKKGQSELITSNVKFQNRNFKIVQDAIEPKLTFTRTANFRFIVGYRFSNKENQAGNNEQSLSHAVNTEIKYNILQSTSLQGKFTYNLIDFRSKDVIPNPNTTTAYILLEGLMPGKNFLWTLDCTKRLSNNLELNIQYEGRKPGTSRVVHVGRAAIRALL